MGNDSFALFCIATEICHQGPGFNTGRLYLLTFALHVTNPPCTDIFNGEDVKSICAALFLQFV